MVTEPPPRVLVVDDDPAILQLFCALFTRAGFKIDTAADGWAAWDLLEKSSYEVIVMDLMMPQLSGFGLVDRIAAQKPSLLPHIIVTTGASKRHLSGFDASRVHSLIRKPFDIEELMNAASDCVHQRRA